MARVVYVGRVAEGIGVSLSLWTGGASPYRAPTLPRPKQGHPLVFGIVDISLATFIQSTLTTATREGSRFAITFSSAYMGTSCAASQAACDVLAVQYNAVGLPLALNTSSITVNSNPFDYFRESRRRISRRVRPQVPVRSFRAKRNGPQAFVL